MRVKVPCTHLAERALAHRAQEVKMKQIDLAVKVDGLGG